MGRSAMDWTLQQAGLEYSSVWFALTLAVLPSACSYFFVPKGLWNQFSSGQFLSPVPWISGGINLWNGAMSNSQHLLSVTNLDHVGPVARHWSRSINLNVSPPDQPPPPDWLRADTMMILSLILYSAALELKGPVSPHTLVVELGSGRLKFESLFNYRSLLSDLEHTLSA